MKAAQKILDLASVLFLACLVIGGYFALQYSGKDFSMVLNDLQHYADLVSAQFRWILK